MLYTVALMASTSPLRSVMAPRWAATVVSAVWFSTAPLW